MNHDPADDYWYIEPGPDPRVAKVMFVVFIAAAATPFIYGLWLYLKR